MFILKSKLTTMCYKIIEETAHSCGRNLSERQKKDLFNKVYKAVKYGKRKKKNS